MPKSLSILRLPLQLQYALLFVLLTFALTVMYATRANNPSKPYRVKLKVTQAHTSFCVDRNNIKLRYIVRRSLLELGFVLPRYPAYSLRSKKVK